MPRKTYKEKYWSWSEEQREAHRAFMRDYQRKRYVPKRRVPRINTGQTFHANVKDYIDSVKIKIGECADCKMPCQDWNCMMFAFDHLDPAQKSFGLARAQHQKNCTQELIDNEIAKCELVCHNCHAYRTWCEKAHLTTNAKPVVTLPLMELIYATND